MVAVVVVVVMCLDVRAHMRACVAVVFRERLGSKADGITAIKTHQWFAGFDWGGVQAGEYFNQVQSSLVHHIASLVDVRFALVWRRTWQRCKRLPSWGTCSLRNDDDQC